MARRGPYDVWAPRPSRVRLVAGDSREPFEMERDDDGWWTPAG
jgi:maltooligosyltrehalose trehalohydrolase